MAKRGRPTIPDAVKAKSGTLRSHRVNKNAPVAPAIEKVPEPPDYLEGAGITEWKRIVDQLDRMKLLAVTDFSVLGALCMEWQLYLDHRIMQQKHKSFYMKKDANGQNVFMPHPVHYNGSAHLKLYLEMCREFGLTPAARSKISVPQNNNQSTSPMAGLLKKTG
jgi:P27 family predicted phage terminase small subunit